MPMSDDEYRNFLRALVSKHREAFRKVEIDLIETRMQLYADMFQTLKRARSTDFSEKVLNELNDRLEGLRVRSAQELLEESGMEEAIDDGWEVILCELRRSAIPDEDVGYLKRIGLRDDEIEVALTTAVTIARRLSLYSNDREMPGLAYFLFRPLEERFEEAKSYLRTPALGERPKHKSKILSGFGDTIIGLASITANVGHAAKTGQWDFGLASVAAGFGSLAKAFDSFRGRSS
jgi:hypothetical protein